MPHIVLHQPEIPPNTGNIIRLCANTGTTLHLVHPLGFTMTKKSLRRAYLDYEEFTKITHHNNIKEMIRQQKMMAEERKEMVSYIYLFINLFKIGTTRETFAIKKQIEHPNASIYLEIKNG